MVSTCLKECLLNLGVMSPTEVGQRHQGDIYVFLSRINSTSPQISSMTLANLMEVSM